MRIKNLDTGEEYDLEDYDTQPLAASGHHWGLSGGDHTGALDEGEELPNRGVGGKTKAWLKNTKKIKTWAKTTLTNVKEKIEERIEKRQLQQQLQQQQLPSQPERQKTDSQQLQQTQSTPLQQEKEQQRRESCQSDSLGYAGGGDDIHEPQVKMGPAGTAPLAPRDMSGPLEHGVHEGRLETGALEAGTDIGTAVLLDSTLTGGLEGAVDDGLLYGRGDSFSGSVTSASTVSAVVLKKHGMESAVGGGGGGGSAVGRHGGALADGTSLQRSSRQAPPASAAPVPAAPAAAAVAAAAASATEALRGSSVPKAAAAAKPQVPPLPSFRGLISQPLAAGTAVAVAAAPAASSVASVSGLSVTSLAQPQQQHSSEELRQPLLEDDWAGPSSRAVPSGKSWLNQPARVVGGRRAANRQLQQVRMVQELLGHDGPVWAMKFSADARLLATAGRDGVLRVWSVYWYGAGRFKPIAPARDEVAAPAGVPLSCPSGLTAAAASSTGASELRPQLLSESPLLHLPGHRSDVLDLSWSQCRLLLTASADQTARLWCIDVPVGAAAPGGGGRGGGVRRASGSGAEGSGGEGPGAGGGGGPGPSGECLRSFVHPDFVTSCCFHPADPRRIVTGCADGKIRVWSVPDAAVVATATVQQDFITRVLFSSSGSRVVAGTLRGKAYYYDFTAANGGGGLEYVTQLDVKNKHSSGRKVTGLAQVPYTYGNDQLYVITSADSRIRLYVGYTQECKFKGHRHTNTQIAASLSPSCQHMICGSDDGWVYVWETGLPPPQPPGPGPPAGSFLGAPGGAGLAGGKEAAGPGRSRAAAKEAAAAVAALRGGGGGGKFKEGSYEAFQTPEQTTTVAIFAPNVCRLGRGLQRPPVRPSAATSGTGMLGDAGAQPPLLGALFVVAGFTGKIYVYENMTA